MLKEATLLRRTRYALKVTRAVAYRRRGSDLLRRQLLRDSLADAAPKLQKDNTDKLNQLVDYLATLMK